MADEQQTVGILGLGQMGGAMCRTLLRAGWRVIAWDIAPAAVEAAVTAGAQAATSAAEVAAQTTLLITSLPDAHIVRSILLGEHGVAETAVQGTLVVDTSTTSPTEARALAADLVPHGIGFLDAPVSGGVKGAESGHLAVMVSGPEESVERARPLLDVIGSAVVHVGPVGAGQIAKACNQLVVMAAHAAIAEALVLASASGLDPWRVREVLMAGYAASPILEIQGPRMLNHDFAPGGRAKFHLKDIATITELAQAAGLELPAFAATAGQIEKLVSSGGGDLDNSAIITVVEAGVAAGG